MRMTVEQKWPEGWKTVGIATTLNGAERVARRECDPEGFGGFKHPEGGLKYGTIRVIEGENIYFWDNALQMFLGVK